MTRVNVFVTAGNDNREVRIGGRSRESSRGWAELNTDNQDGSDIYLKIKAEVVGQSRYNNGALRKTCHNCDYRFEETYPGDIKRCPECGEIRQGVDTRKSFFEVHLPQNTPHTHVEIRAHGAGLRDVAHMGAMLVGLKGIILATSDDPQEQLRGQDLLERLPELLEGLQEKLSDIPQVTLPGGVDLRYALACVQIVEDLQKQAQNPQDNPGEN